MEVLRVPGDCRIEQVRVAVDAAIQRDQVADAGEQQRGMRGGERGRHATIDLLEIAQRLLLLHRSVAGVLAVEDRAALAAAAGDAGMELMLFAEFVAGEKGLQAGRCRSEERRVGKECKP